MYRAKDTRLDREVAVKILPESLAKDSDRLARFEQEARILGQLSPPNLPYSMLAHTTESTTWFRNCWKVSR